jgi:YaiO family outer membrane protein
MYLLKYKIAKTSLSGCLSLILCMTSICVIAQDTTSTDGLFQMAHKAAFDENDYSKAKDYCNKILETNPHYIDATVFLGRIYAWSKQYDSARITFQKALNQKADYEDASIAYADAEYWNDNNNEALKVIDSALTYHPQSTDLLLRKAKVLNALRDYTEASKIVNEILKTDKNNAEARALAARLKDNAALNKVGVSYDYVYFDKQFNQPWHFVSVDYTRQTRLGSIIPRINYANRFGENGLQYEVDAYPHISKLFYAYANVGYSNNDVVFPHWRAGFSLYTNLPKSFELETGWRYLYFSTPTNMFVGYVGKYYKNYLFGFRTYITPGNNRTSESYNAFMRYYFGGADDFVGFGIGTGISPDENSLSQQLNNPYELKTFKTAAEFRHVIKTFNIIGVTASLINQEYQPKTTGNQIQIGIKYQRRF